MSDQSFKITIAQAANRTVPTKFSTAVTFHGILKREKKENWKFIGFVMFGIYTHVSLRPFPII